MADQPAACPNCGARLVLGSPIGGLCPRCLVLLAVEPRDEPVSDQSFDVAFGPYRLLEQVGEGGMGVVYRAQQEHPIRRIVALKVVKPGRDSRHVLSRFDSERQALAILNHPNIATVFDAGVTADGRPYFVMEYVPGLPVTAFADQNALPIRARLELFLQLCEGIEHAHQKGLIHRDLKPTNILVTAQDDRPVVKIIDFGVAKAIGPHLSADTVETQDGALLGTPEYMSPEQAGLTDAGVDTRTDIYSLGLVLYELLVGALPFDGRELRRRAVLDMLRVIREEDPPRLSQRLTRQSDAEVQEIARRRLTEPRMLIRQLRGDLEWITSRALEKEPARRYPTASELRADVDRHLRIEAVLARPPSLAYRAGKLARRHRGLAAATLALSVTVVLAAVLSTVFWIRSERARADARRQLVASLVAGGTARMEAWDWAGGLLAFTKALEIEPDAGRQREHRVRIAQVLQRMPRLVRLWAHGQRVTSVDVSAAGTVASGGTDGIVRLWSLSTGRQIGSPLRHGDAINHVAFSADGSLLATASEDGTARIWRASDGTAVGQPMRHEGGVHHVAFSPVSQVVATAGADGRAALWRPGEDRPYAQVTLDTPVRRIVFTKDGSRFAVGAEARDNQPFTVRLWSTSEGTPAGEEIRGQPGWYLGDMDLARDGSYAVTAGDLGCHCALLWDTATGKPVGNLMRHRNAIPTVRFNPSGTQIVTGGYDRIVQVWNVPTAEPAAPAWTISGWPESVSFAPDGQLVASTVNGAVEMIGPGSNAQQRENARLFPTVSHGGPVTSATFDSSGRLLVTASGDGAVRVWDLSPGLVYEAPFAWYASQWCQYVMFSREGRYLASAARIFDTTSGLPVVPPLRAEAMDFHMALSDDGRRVATSGRRLARVWDTATGEPVSPVLAHQGDLGIVRPLVFSPDGRRLLTVSNPGRKGEATLWDIATGAPVITLEHGGDVTAADFSADGARVMTATAERDTNLRIWNIDRRTVTVSGSHPEGVRLAILDRANDRILTVGNDQRALEWQIGSTLTSREALELHSQPTALAIGGQRTRVAGGRGGDVRVRTIRSGAERTTSMAQPGAVMSADISPDAEWLVTSGDDGRVTLWNLRGGEPLLPAYRFGGPIYAARFSVDGGSFAIGGSGAWVHALAADDRPIALLTDIAELLSARQMADVGDSPLRMDDLVARWDRIASADPPDVGRAAPSWYQRQASLALLRANPRLALDHLAALGAVRRLSWTETTIGLAALARDGRWDEAVQKIRGLAAVRDSAPELSFVEAVARRRAGDVQAARTACGEQLARHGTTQNPDRALWIVRICLLDPEATSDARNAMAQLLRQIVDLPSHGTRDSLTGAVAVRSGRLPEAIDALTRAAAAGEKTPHTALFLAMALARMHRTREATAWLLESEKTTWRPANMFFQTVFRETWFEAEAVVLRDEVRQILAGSVGPTTPGK